jgi:hypothetical protein
MVVGALKGLAALTAKRESTRQAGRRVLVMYIDATSDCITLAMAKALHSIPTTLSRVTSGN